MRVLICNTPLIFNFYKIKNGVKMFNQDKMISVFRSKDYSYQYLPLLKNIENDKVQIYILDGVDHLFKEKIDEFEKLPFKYIL